MVRHSGVTGARARRRLSRRGEGAKGSPSHSRRSSAKAASALAQATMLKMPSAPRDKHFPWGTVSPLPPGVRTHRAHSTLPSAALSSDAPTMPGATAQPTISAARSGAPLNGSDKPGAGDRGSCRLDGSHLIEGDDLTSRSAASGKFGETAGTGFGWKSRIGITGSASRGMVERGCALSLTSKLAQGQRTFHEHWVRTGHGFRNLGARSRRDQLASLAKHLHVLRN